MSVKLDKFTLGVVAAVIVLLVAALFTANRSGGNGAAVTDYVPLDSPQAPVQNAFLAFQNQDIFKAREQYSQRILDEVNSDKGYGPLKDGVYYGPDTSRRLRIVDVQIDPEDADRAVVTIEQDTYSPGGLFGGGSWSSRRAITVVREADGWKIDSLEYF